jgi:hypothetical protein
VINRLAVILDIILRGGSLPVNRLSRSQLSVVELLLESSFVRWNLEDGERSEVGSEDKENHLALFGHEGAEVIWSSSLLASVFEDWFNGQI